MAIRDIDQLLQFLENSAEDELDLLVSTGPEYYPTHQLYRLFGQWQVKSRWFKQFNTLILWIAALAPAWLILGISALAFSWRWTGLFFLALFPLSFVLFFAGLFFMRRMFRSKGHLESAGDRIVQELKKRASE